MDSLMLKKKENDKLGSEIYNPLDIGRIFISLKDEKIIGLAVESSEIYKGILHELSEIADEIGVIIRFIQFSMPKPGEKTAKGIAFIDISNAKVSPRRALEILKSKKYVKKVTLIRPFLDGMVSDNYFFPLVILNERVAIFRRSVYGALFEGVRRQFGSAGEAFLYYQGFGIGFKIFDEYAKLAGSMDAEKIAKVARAVNMTLGWGIIELVDIDVESKTAIARIYQSFECELGKGSDKPYSQFYRGATAGLFTRFFGKEVEVEEVKCIAKGDPYCEFFIKAK